MGERPSVNPDESLQSHEDDDDDESESTSNKSKQHRGGILRVFQDQENRSKAASGEATHKPVVPRLELLLGDKQAEQSDEGRVVGTRAVEQTEPHQAATADDTGGENALDAATEGTFEGDDPNRLAVGEAYPEEMATVQGNNESLNTVAPNPDDMVEAGVNDDAEEDEDDNNNTVAPRPHKSSLATHKQRPQTPLVSTSTSGPVGQGQIPVPIAPPIPVAQNILHPPTPNAWTPNPNSPNAPIVPFGPNAVGGNVMPPVGPNMQPTGPNNYQALNTLNGFTSPEAHEHPHIHWKMAALFGGALLVEHIFRKREVGKVKETLARQKEQYQKRFERYEAEQRLDVTRQRSMNAQITELDRIRAEQDVRLHSHEQQMNDLQRVMDQQNAPNGISAVVSGTERGRQDAANRLSPLSREEASGSKSEVSQLQPEKHADTPRPRFVADRAPEAVSQDEATIAERRAGVLVYEQAPEVVSRTDTAERAYERRSEVKDEMSKSGGQGGGSAPSLYPTQQMAARQMAENRAIMHSQSPTRSGREQYKTAVNQGFAAAVVLIILALIAYLVMR